MPALALSPTPVTEPVTKVAHALVAHLKAGEPIDQRLLRHLFESACSQASTRDHRSIRHAYDALELAQILLLTSPAWSEQDDNLGTLAALAALIDQLPTQSIRTEEQLALQQFSTPAPIAWLMARAAALTSADTLLEPSAGTGMLAWPAARAGARLILNEIDPVRRLCLREAFGDEVIDQYTRAGTWEQEEYDRRVTDWEVARGFERA